MEKSEIDDHGESGPKCSILVCFVEGKGGNALKRQAARTTHG
jgi:hypothetical protein